MLLRACVVLHPHYITNIDYPEKLSACQESLSQAIPCKFYAYGAYTLPPHESVAPLSCAAMYAIFDGGII
jgi:hypothetical protein